MRTMRILRIASFPLSCEKFLSTSIMTFMASLGDEKTLEHIWHQVPPDYYQKGVSENLLQKMWHTRKLKIVLDLLGNNHNSILDVGCASGWFLSEVQKRNPKAVCEGVDVYKAAIEYGKKKYPTLKLRYADAHKLPFRDESFDGVICSEVLEHVVEPERVLREIKRVLKPEGIAVVEMDSGNFLFRLIWYWWTHLRHGVWEDAHIHSFTAEKLENMIQQVGFAIKKKKRFNCSMAIAFQLQKSGVNEASRLAWTVDPRRLELLT